MVFQQPNLFPWRTVLGNVEFGLAMGGVGKAARRRRATDLLGLVGLADFTAAYPDELSGGMAQRVALARALALSPDVLLMDEPFGALDAQTREDLQSELVRIWHEVEMTIVFVTHSVQEATYLADRVLVMSRRPGTIVQETAIDLTRPHDVTAPGFGEYMRELYGALARARTHYA